MTCNDMCKRRSQSTLACFADLNHCPNYKVYPRIYLQYNELVFDGMNTIQTASLSGDYKTEFTPYPFTHGSYYGGSFKRGRLLTGAQDLSLDITIPFSHLNRIQVLNYYDYIMYNMTQAGKIWAMDTGGILIWAWAIPKHPPYPNYETKNGKQLSFSMDFTLPEGMWHRADTNHVYLQPYDMCDFKDMIGTGCGHDCTVTGACQNKQCEFCCGCENDQAYCNTCWNPYQECANPYRIIYNCSLDESNQWGELFVQEPDCRGIFGTYCSNTVYDAQTEVTLLGDFVNPKVTINDVTISLKGTYHGRLVFKRGKVCYYQGEPSDKVIEPKTVPLDDITFSQNELGFLSHNGENWLQVLYDNKNALMNMAWVNVDEVVV